ncbi:MULTISPECIES: GntR family transcriptional regulator [Mameliella]|uniref:GntR family transcriptional regulator n=1 Tax=Mameliella alba TaxID=561184 RepID=A0A0B3S4N2_9RHOB|nr:MULTISPECIES: GntR family transcriptional regulator [Mameliella]KHQ51656.1 GntR family transcriptional regulator [Mameliella alba]MBY6120347.1 GntR family transcriptional regulator [Mameliella alba]OWV40947.1 GntR family transcriptional regulator [Mameliella alba]OWV46290.1 GntR family transcriptional regulator [Mameliella alba]OWV53645.1 GntR family transcriptional regulator [Mameliella alba]
MSKVEVKTQKQAKGLGARHVYETLKKEILTLALEPGTPLDETTLSQRFAMSRSPIREALVRLSADGLVEMLSNRSTLVAPINLAEFPRYVEALDFLQRINTRLAARHATPDDIKKMRALAKAFDDACRANDYLAMSATNRDFHMSIANAGRNLYLARSYGQLLDEGRRILHMHFDYIRRSDTDALLNPEHYEMIDAIEKRDISLADRLAHEHTRQFHNRFMEFLRARYDDDFEFELETPISGSED